MKPLLSKTRLDTMRRTLYGGNVTAVFHKVTPTAGEAAIVTITSGFHVQREQRAGQEIDGFGVNIWLSKDAAITQTQLKISKVIALTINGATTKYSIKKVEPMQQLGSGYVLRLLPLTGATG